ncbi:MAG: sigma 54-interacting transcriptional regulator [Acidobacteria bacterium]|nr:sigma 54-interacting transcriptional regulator [Acidobacteriota bacterium]
MVRLLRDRYFAHDQLHGCDLVTGEPVRLDELREEESPPPESALAPLLEVLDHGRDGDPRWVVASARTGAQTAALVRRAAAHAGRKGYVPILVDLYTRLSEALAEDLRERALLLLGGHTADTRVARAALVRAAAHSRRPHVLLTFEPAVPAHRDGLVCEARTTYSVAPQVRPRAATSGVSADVALILQRADRAAAYQRSGRHAAAERGLREAASALLRRHAPVPAAAVLVRLGRLLLERGRARDADTACDEAARLAESAKHDALVSEARLWQAASRTDAGRLIEAESVCRAVLLASGLLPLRRDWARAVLARTLLWQGRIDEAVRLDFAPLQDGPVGRPEGRPLQPSTDDEGERDMDHTAAAWIRATRVRVLLAEGQVFEAGQQARALLAGVDACSDPLPRLIAHTAHLRLLTAAGDLTLAHQSLALVLELARRARAPLRAARARLIWYDGLRRAGRHREAQRELDRLGRIGRASPPLLRRAIEQRLASTTPVPSPPPVRTPPQRVSSAALALLQVAHVEDSDTTAARRILEQVAMDLHASRVDLLSADAGPISTILTTGSGLATRLGSRVLEAGIVLPMELQHGGREIGIPIRLGARLLAALVCRWPLDRDPPPHTLELLELAAAVAAPRIDALLAEARETARASTSVPELVGTSGAMAEVRRAIERAAAAPFAVLIEGESGVGKELVARAIHQLGPRRERRLCDVNCAALPDDLLESELFGHARGAFTGAIADRPGLFEEADGGTLFLDELPDLSPRGQAKLLRVLQQHEVRRIGETFSRKVDVRLVTATNRDMQGEVAEGRFRRDLLYRLDVIRIRIPPLRDRPEDVPVLAEHFWHAAAHLVGSSATLTHGILSALARYHWPGNIRELQNVVAALAVAAPARGRVQASLLPSAIASTSAPTPRRLAEARLQFERRCVEVALARAGGRRTRAAAELGLSRQGLLKTMARLGMTGRGGDATATKREEAEVTT